VLAIDDVMVLWLVLGGGGGGRGGRVMEGIVRAIRERVERNGRVRETMMDDKDDLFIHFFHRFCSFT
jgi:hypothetical protein